MMVPVVALGARTPVGYRAHTSAAAFRCEIRRIQEHPFMVDRAGEPVRMGLDHGIDDGNVGSVRLVVLARAALREALGKLELTGEPKIDVLLALPEVRPGFADAQVAWVAQEVGAGIIAQPLEVAARGHAGALDAVRIAVERIEAGQADVCAIVGVDSYVAPQTVEWLDDSGRLAREGNRDGFIPGESGACVVLANPSLGFRPLAYVRGASSAHEPVTIRGDGEVLGHGLAAAIQGATRGLRLPGDAVDNIYGDINGERYRTDEWAMCALRVSESFRSLQYTRTSVSAGDLGAAHGALGCILAQRAWARGYANGPRALVYGGSELGLRSAVVLEEAPGACEVRR